MRMTSGPKQRQGRELPSAACCATSSATPSVPWLWTRAGSPRPWSASPGACMRRGTSSPCRCWPTPWKTPAAPTRISWGTCGARGRTPEGAGSWTWSSVETEPGARPGLRGEVVTSPGTGGASRPAPVGTGRPLPERNDSSEVHDAAEAPGQLVLDGLDDAVAVQPQAGEVVQVRRGPQGAAAGVAELVAYEVEHAQAGQVRRRRQRFGAGRADVVGVQ